MPKLIFSGFCASGRDLILHKKKPAGTPGAACPIALLFTKELCLLFENLLKFLPSTIWFCDSGHQALI